MKNHCCLHNKYYGNDTTEYISNDKAIAMMPQEARLYEPIVALDGGNDGLEVQRRVVAEAPLWLASGGKLLMETSQRQSVKTAELFSNR